MDLVSKALRAPSAMGWHLPAGRIALAVAAVAGATLAGVATPSAQASLVLADQNSRVTIDPTAGVQGYRINNVNQISKQEFLYRIGPSGGALNVEQLSAPVVTPSNPTNNTEFDYNNGQLAAKVTYALTGGPVNTSQSSLMETLTITNLTNQPISDFHVFKFADYNINDTIHNDHLVLTAPNTPANATQSEAGKQSVTTTITGPDPSHVEAYPSGLGLLTALEFGQVTTLNDVQSIDDDIECDLSFALQWDTTLAPHGQPGDTFQIGIPTTFVPEPASTAGVVLGGGALMLRRRRRVHRPSR
jgi:hypothetical protein